MRRRCSSCRLLPLPGRRSTALEPGLARRDLRRATRGSLRAACASAMRAVGGRGAGPSLVCVSDAAAGRETRADPVAARRRRRPPPAGRARASVRACSLLVVEDGRATRTGRLPARLRRRRDLPAARPRALAPIADDRQARRRPADAGRGAGELPRGARGRRAQGHVQDGHLRHRGYRGAQIFEAVGLDRRGRRPLLRRHPVADRRHRLRPARARCPRPPPAAQAAKPSLENPASSSSARGASPMRRPPRSSRPCMEGPSESVRGRPPAP